MVWQILPISWRDPQASIISESCVPDPGAAATGLISGASRDLLAHTSTSTQQAMGPLLRSAYAAGLDRIFLVSGITALVAGVAVLGLVRSPARSEQSPTRYAIAAPGRHG